MVGCFADMWDKISDQQEGGTASTATAPTARRGRTRRRAAPSTSSRRDTTYTMPGLYQPGLGGLHAADQRVQEVRRGDLLRAAMPQGDFTNFWKQAIQQGFNPKMCTVGQALNFAETANAIGPTVIGLTTEISWHPDYPYKRLLHRAGPASSSPTTTRRTPASSGRPSSSCTPSWSGSSRALKSTTNVDDKAACSWQPSSTPRWRPSTARSTSRCRWTRPPQGDSHPSGAQLPAHAHGRRPVAQRHEVALREVPGCQQVRVRMLRSPRRSRRSSTRSGRPKRPVLER